MSVYRTRLAEDLARWGGFRRALLRNDGEAFDSLVDHSLRFAGGAEAYRERDVFDLFLMSSLLSHEERLGFLERELRTRMKVDDRLL